MTGFSDVRRLREKVGDLIAKHEKARDVRDFERYRDDPSAFFREVLRCEPWAKQDEMAAMVRDAPRSVVVTSNGIGKDWIVGRIALWWAYARRGLCILSGPTERQVKQILMIQLQYTRGEADTMVARAWAANRNVKTIKDLLGEVFKLQKMGVR